MKTEFAFYGILLLALLLRMMGIEGSGPLLILSLGGLSLLYHLPGLYFFSVGKISNQNWGITIAAILLLSVAPIAFLFSIMHWSGDSAMRYLSLAGVPFVGFLTFYYRNRPSSVPTAYFNNMLIRCGLTMGLTLLSFL